MEYLIPPFIMYEAETVFDDIPKIEMNKKTTPSASDMGGLESIYPSGYISPIFQIQSQLKE